MANKKRTQNRRNKRSGKKQRRRTAAKKQRGGGNKNIQFYIQDNGDTKYTSGIVKYYFERNIEYKGNYLTKQDILKSFHYNNEQEIHLAPGKTYDPSDGAYTNYMGTQGTVHKTPFNKYFIHLREYGVFDDSIRQDSIAIHPINELEDIANAPSYNAPDI